MKEHMHDLLGSTDIYLLDQIMKGRYGIGDVLLDAGCGSGRNLHWFFKNGFDVYGVDENVHAIEILKQAYKEAASDHFRIEAVEHMSFDDDFFDHVISSAVLHFAQAPDHFFAMMQEMLRVLKTGGSLFIRMASDIGIEQAVQPAGNGVYYLPDGSTRFLLTRRLLQQLTETFPVSFIEPFKTVNVSDLRCMSTLVLQKI